MSVEDLHGNVDEKDVPVVITGTDSTEFQLESARIFTRTICRSWSRHIGYGRYGSG
jgi:hypothetical protein